ncbi:MAG: hypothetical protein K2N94_15975 [Lachnospiraceae bacterium]|nr:hypothetical protein [Lachnospiraceae bacterium]
MLRFRSPVYFGESMDTERKRQRLMEKLSRGRHVRKGVTLILYAVNGKDLFDLLPARELKRPWRKGEDFYVLGLAANREEALQLVQRMVMEVYESTGDFDVRGYFGYPGGQPDAAQ